MIISAHQPAYIPWFGYFHKIINCDKFVILDEVQFEKNSYINRNYIMNKNGTFLLTVPVNLTNHINSKIKDIKIQNSTNWQRKHFNSIYLSYKNTKYFKLHEDFIEYIYSKKWNFINELNNEILIYILNSLNVNTEILKMSELKIKGNKEELIINLCENLGGETFLFGANGRDYINVSNNSKSNISYLFQEFDTKKCYSYRDNIPEKNLSILDLLFNVDNNQIIDLLDNYGKTGQ